MSGFTLLASAAGSPKSRMLPVCLPTTLNAAGACLGPTDETRSRREPCEVDAILYMSFTRPRQGKARQSKAKRLSLGIYELKGDLSSNAFETSWPEQVSLAPGIAQNPTPAMANAGVPFKSESRETAAARLLKPSQWPSNLLQHPP